MRRAADSGRPAPPRSGRLACMDAGTADEETVPACCVLRSPARLQRAKIAGGRVEAEQTGHAGMVRSHATPSGRPALARREKAAQRQLTMAPVLS